MILLTCFLLTLFCLVIWLPFEVEVDTVKGMYRGGWKGIFVVRGIETEKAWKWYYRLFFFKKEWKIPDLFSKSPKEKPVRKKKDKKGMSPRQFWQLLKRSFQAIQIKKFRINWDTNNYITNAYLYPLTHIFAKRKHQFHINFIGKQEVSIHLQARPYRLVWAFLLAMFYRK